MIDMRPVAYVIGLLVAVLGATMSVPLAVDLAYGNGHWPAFLLSGVLAGLVGGLTALSCASRAGAGLTLQQTFLLTTLVWVALPAAGSLPFIFGATDARVVDAFFEAMSGMTTTGSTVFTGLDHLPKGLLLWRGMLQWFGGIGIIVVAMVFLPELKIGGMQIFRSEAFETMGKILPRAAEIAARISFMYVALTVGCAITFFALGMSGFDAIVHAMTTISTGGFANYDASFGQFNAPETYACGVYMLLAALPFVRFVQLVHQGPQPMFRDSQVRAFLGTFAVVTLVLFLYVEHIGMGGEEGFREAFFNTSSIMTGTGYANTDYMKWGPFAVGFFFFAGLIGGCAGSTACSIKIFRYQILFAAIITQIKRIHSPSGIFVTRFEGRPVDDDTLASVMAFFVMFILSIGVLSVALTLTGLDFITALSSAATALANVGPGLGDQVGPAGNFAGLNDLAKWMLALGMLVGRLEVMVVFTILTFQFWRA
ncbi:TrkH family potassium uptake protein [Mangrovicoccus algicola]|uniref:Trk system potassium uptake protein n=1 Tax=Mangrovicoccus algicola TaxID=2771008 RepID=A0A8J6YSL7_9RHOB|nr:TrkH family potassium uptake protein [Mangrovicoccus algicola]MBE3636805.1 TrkH family potassium uptake protein [Mangrovicoccus algicola]